jgi:transcriptional regulator with XRE-family HTH domain
MSRKRIHPLAAYRKANKLSQIAAAKQFKVSQAAWSRWERGIDRPSRELAKELIEKTGVSAEVLLGVAS